VGGVGWPAADDDELEGGELEGGELDDGEVGEVDDDDDDDALVDGERDADTDAGSLDLAEHCASALGVGGPCTRARKDV
jgi:hypothetical protein